MFRERVEIPVDPIPKVYADSLVRLENEPDYSLTSLGIALLTPRIEQYSGIKGTYYNFEDKADAVKDFICRVEAVDTYPLYCYYIYSSDSEIKDLIKEQLPDFKERQDISKFINEKSGHNCTVLYHEDKCVVGIFINTRDIRMYHLMMSFVSLFYPSLFKEKKMDEKEFNLVKSLVNKEKDKFYACVKILLEPHITFFRRFQMETLMKNIHEEKISKALSDVSSHRDAVRYAEEEYGRAVENLKRVIVVYEGLKATESYDNQEEEFVEYLTKNKNIHCLNIENGYFKFSVTTQLVNYNEDAWRTFSERGFIFDGDYRTTLPDVFRIEKNRRILLNNIFSEEPEFAINMAGNYCFNLNRSTVGTIRDYDYVNNDPVFKNYLPNPHLKLFECLGGYSQRIMDALRERNYILAVEICIASAGSVNLDETDQTFRPFIGWILTSKEKILVRKDGTEMTPEEALIWLIDKEKENEAD